MTEQASPPKLAYTEAEAAKALGVSVRTLYEWRKAGRIDFVKVGPKVLYPTAALFKFLGQNEVHAK